MVNLGRGGRKRQCHQISHQRNDVCTLSETNTGSSIRKDKINKIRRQQNNNNNRIMRKHLGRTEMQNKEICKRTKCQKRKIKRNKSQPYVEAAMEMENEDTTSIDLPSHMESWVRWAFDIIQPEIFHHDSL